MVTGVCDVFPGIFNHLDTLPHNSLVLSHISHCCVSFLLRVSEIHDNSCFGFLPFCPVVLFKFCHLRVLVVLSHSWLSSNFRQNFISFSSTPFRNVPLFDVVPSSHCVVNCAITRFEICSNFTFSFSNSPHSSPVQFH